MNIVEIMTELMSLGTYAVLSIFAVFVVIPVIDHISRRIRGY